MKTHTILGLIRFINKFSKLDKPLACFELHSMKGQLAGKFLGEINMKKGRNLIIGYFNKTRSSREEVAELE